MADEEEADWSEAPPPEERWFEGLSLQQIRDYCLKRATPADDLQELLATERLKAKRIAERECGSCRLCCKNLQIVEKPDVAGVDFDKKRHVWCQHAGSGGCAIHEDQSQIPVACASFLCAWRGGYLEDDERPDRLKAVPKLEAGPPIGHAITWYLNQGATELNSKARRAAQRMLDGQDNAVSFPLPQLVSVASGLPLTVVLPGMPMKDAKGRPGRRRIARWQTEFAVMCAGGAGEQAYRRSLKPQKTSGLLMPPDRKAPRPKR